MCVCGDGSWKARGRWWRDGWERGMLDVRMVAYGAWWAERFVMWYGGMGTGDEGGGKG